jgi:16S rRNA (guanine527-N7)-methyltransferase
MKFSDYPEVKEFEGSLKQLGITITEMQYQQFMDYYELLIERNKVMNLTAITELNEVITKHFIDSLAMVKAIKPEKERLLDIGTGAGFPGIPLKIAFPDLDIVLLDSLKKRLTFLDEVINQLGLKGIRTLHGRAEDFGREKDYREQFDLCVSRAVARLSSLSEYCLPYVKIGGCFISYKSGNIEEELTSSTRAMKLLGAELKEVIEYQLPDTDIQRTLIVVEKKSSTPKSYPRAAGKPSKDPL